MTHNPRSHSALPRIVLGAALALLLACGRPEQDAPSGAGDAVPANAPSEPVAGAPVQLAHATLPSAADSARPLLAPYGRASSAPAASAQPPPADPAQPPSANPAPPSADQAQADPSQPPYANPAAPPSTAPAQTNPSQPAPADPTADPSQPPPSTQPSAPATSPSADAGYLASLTADFAFRDSLPETDQPDSTSSFGPPAATYPAVTVPSGVADPLQWKRDRVIEVAKHYLGLPYEHKHIPSAGGLDCSNFTAWVYNYGFGVRFTSNVVNQADQAGRLLDPSEPLQEGDLLYITDSAGTAIAHVVIYIDATHIIDSTSSATPNGVNIRAFQGWYRSRFSHARRIFE